MVARTKQALTTVSRMILLPNRGGEGSMCSSTVGTSDMVVLMAGVSHHAAGGAGVFAQLSGGDKDRFHLVGVSWRQLIWVRVDQVGLYLWSNVVHLSAGC